MKFLVVSHVDHSIHDGKIYGYGPYVKEMNLWLKYVDEFILVAPVSEKKPSPIDLPYEKNPEIYRVPSFSITSPVEIIRTLFKLPRISKQIISAMKKADHIHLRFPGNMGLLGGFWQFFFPGKPKTVKYAGNWDPGSPQPWSYRLQKRMASSPFWMKNAKVLVYGKWPDQSRNIIPFFTASYRNSEIEDIPVRSLNPPLRLLFVGTLADGKRPDLAVKILKKLSEEDIPARLDIFGDGPLRGDLEKFIRENRMESLIKIHGKQSSEKVKEGYKNSHFLIFPSRSEGWPKVVAEAMVWKCLPITTPVSAVPYMLGNGERGSLIEPTVEAIVDEIKFYLKNPEIYRQKVEAAHRWSKQFTLEKFEEEIKKLL